VRCSGLRPFYIRILAPWRMSRGLVFYESVASPHQNAASNPGRTTSCMFMHGLLSGTHLWQSYTCALAPHSGSVNRRFLHWFSLGLSGMLHRPKAILYMDLGTMVDESRIGVLSECGESTPEITASCTFMHGLLCVIISILVWCVEGGGSLVFSVYCISSCVAVSSGLSFWQSSPLSVLHRHGGSYPHSVVGWLLGTLVL